MDRPLSAYNLFVQSKARELAERGQPNSVRIIGPMWTNLSRPNRYYWQARAVLNEFTPVQIFWFLFLIFIFWILIK